MRAVLATDASGLYSVTWTTVSLVDGHTLHGGFQFGVLVAPARGHEDSTVVTPGRLDLLVAVARTVEDAGLFLAMGMLVLRRLGHQKPCLPWIRSGVSIPLVCALLGGATVVVGETVVAAGGLSAGALVAYLGVGLPGAARIARIAAETAALLVAFSGAAGAIMSAPLVVALVALATAGHAAAVRPPVAGIGIDVIHVLSAAVWAGGILALATVRPPSGWRGPDGVRLLDRFSRIALPAFCFTVSSGVVRAIQEVGDPGDLWTTSYGHVLAMKTVAVLLMVPLSLLTWFRRPPSLRVEPVLAICVIGAAALVAAHPLPPARIGEAEATRVPLSMEPVVGGLATAGRADVAGTRPAVPSTVQRGIIPSSALPEPGDFTLGSNAGTVLVGLTVRPGIPGRNLLLLYVLPIDGEETAAAVPIELAVNGRSVLVEPCAPTCRTAALDLNGGEHVEARVPTNQGGTATFDLPRFPAADGASVWNQTQARMRDLRTVHIDEVFTPAEPPRRTTYALQAPDRLASVDNTGTEVRFVGDTRYSRDSATAHWRSEPSGSPLQIPVYAWDAPGDRHVIAPRLTGLSRQDDIETQTLVFFERTGQLPMWFRLWVDTTGLVHRAEMRAQGHVMDQRLYDFDAPFVVTPPVP